MQSSNVPVHATTSHAELTHAATVFAAAHELLHAPQFALSLERSISQPSATELLQSKYGVKHDAIWH